MSSEDAKSGATTRSKPTTRSSSLRQSLSLASVGKALIAGVRSKDSSDDSKASKKSKLAARRHSALPPLAPAPTNASRASLGGDARPPTKRENTPESKTITRKRPSAAPATQPRSSADELGSKPSEPMSQNISARSARPRTATTASALPKPRPRSQAVEPAAAKPSTPVRAGTRRRFSISSEDGGKEQQKPTRSPQEQKEKDARPISPLPQRAALKVSSAVNATPPATPSTPSTRIKAPTPTANRQSPTRPAKSLKTSTTTAAVSAPVRPPSSASSVSSSFTPRTPTASALKAVLTRSAKDKTASGASPAKGSPSTPSRDSPSPLARFSRKHGNAASSTSSQQTGNMSHISEANDEDSDEDDVELLLAPVANLAAPTPAMPRITQRARPRKDAETPSKVRTQPSATSKDKSRLAPPMLITPASTRLRAPRPPGATSSGARHSILSWEQFANEASRTLGDGEIERMITDIPAPFSGPTSPALSSIIDIPPSPCLSAIDSPGGFGSISQVLLPDVTPSPAPFNSARFSVSPEAAGESSSTYLRLQLASAEGLVQEKMLRIQAMEEEIHNLKQAHMQQMEEVAKQMAFMEREDERAGYTASLEEQLRVTRMSNERAVEEAVRQSEELARRQQDHVLKAQRVHFELACSAMVAESAWDGVSNQAKTELEAIQGERAMLALLLADLEYLDVFS